MKTEVYIVRHGETDWNKTGRLQGREDIPLNADGIKQAEQLGAYFMDRGIKKIISSPLKRAFLTATVIAQALGIESVETAPALIERDYGTASGLTQEEYFKRFPHGTIPEGREPHTDLWIRAGQAFGNIIANSGEDTILIVTHGGVIRSLISHYHKGHVESIKVRPANGSITKYRVNRGEWELEFFNYTPFTN